uniref:ribonuclease H n=1 Tax=Diabrotica virgifera virgifera TaxID=50390 RepID=A0A6P7GYG6_DIAVI
MAYETVNMGKEANNQIKFMEWYLNNWSEYKLIFTDGSKDKQGNVGIGIYLNERTQLTARLPSANSICSAEVFAIKKALELIQQNNFTKCLICSDFKSALEKITRSSYKAAIDSQTLQLKQKLCEFDEQHIEIKFAWIPSHTGIIGNDRADHLANLGRKLPISEEPKASFKDFQIKYKENLWIGWENRFQQIGQAKGITYCSQVTVPYKKAWFTKFPNLGRGIITQMCRMRSGHCSVPVHLFRLKVVNSNQCLCGSVGTLQHVLLECTRFQRESQLLRRELEDSGAMSLSPDVPQVRLLNIQVYIHGSWPDSPGS